VDATTPHRPRSRAADDDFFVIVAPPRPRIAEGKYEAKSVSVTRKEQRLWDRVYLEMLFTVFDGPATDGVVLATGLQGFLSLGNGKSTPGPSSKIARLVQLFDPNAKLTEVRSSDLKNKLWKVEVVTVTTDRNGKLLPEANQYSKVADILERLS
jgi:hypothetical protein